MIRKKITTILKILTILVTLIVFLSGFISCNKSGNENSLFSSSDGNADFKDPRIVSNIEIGHCKKVTVHNNHAFVLDSFYGLRIINLNNKRQPVIENSIRTPQPNDLCIIQDTIYISDYIEGIIIADISDSTNLLMVGEIRSPNQTFSIHYNEDHLFVTTQYTYYEKKYSSLIIYDIKDKYKPKKISEFDRLPWINDIYVDRYHAFLTFNDSDSNTTGLIIIDISSIENPEFTCQINTTGFAVSVTVEKDHAFIADDRSGLKIIDISSREKPVLISTLEVDDHATDVAITENYAYISDGYNGIKKVNLTDINNPEIIDNIETFGFAKGLDIYEDHIYIADSKYLTITKKF